MRIYYVIRLQKCPENSTIYAVKLISFRKIDNILSFSVTTIDDRKFLDGDEVVCLLDDNIIILQSECNKQNEFLKVDSGVISRLCALNFFMDQFANKTTGDRFVLNITVGTYRVDLRRSCFLKNEKIGYTYYFPYTSTPYSNRVFRTLSASVKSCIDTTGYHHIYPTWCDCRGVSIFTLSDSIQGEVKY